MTARCKESSVGYDARMALGAYRGMGAYLRTLIAGREQELLGFCAAGEGDPSLRLVAGGPSFYPVWEQVLLPRMLSRAGVRTFLAPYNTAPLRMPPGIRLVLVVHDLIFLRPFHVLTPSRSLYQNLGRLYRRAVVPQAIRQADHIVCVSHATREQIVDRFGIDDARLSVVPNTLHAEWFDEPADAGRPREPVLLCISGEAPSKNLDGAIRALALLEQQGGLPEELRIFIAGVPAGRHGVMERRGRQLGLRRKIVWLPFLPEAELREQMRRARVTLVPSLEEGFGRPLLEAMACCTPVIASAIPALKEVGGASPQYFNPTDPYSLVHSLVEVVSDPAKRAEMSATGRVQALRYHPNAVRSAVAALWLRLEGLSC